MGSLYKGDPIHKLGAECRLYSTNTLLQNEWLGQVINY